MTGGTSDDKTEQSPSETYWEAVRRGREVARKSRYDGLNNPKLAELLPELSVDEVQVLGENIEKAVKDEVQRTLLQRQREVPTADE